MLNVHCKNGDVLIEIHFVGLDLLAGKRDFNLQSSPDHPDWLCESTMPSIQWVLVALFPGGTVGWA
jgi:hypothetical protein